MRVKGKEICEICRAIQVHESALENSADLDLPADLPRSAVGTPAGDRLRPGAKGSTEAEGRWGERRPECDRDQVAVGPGAVNQPLRQNPDLGGGSRRRQPRDPNPAMCPIARTSLGGRWRGIQASRFSPNWRSRSGRERSPERRTVVHHQGGPAVELRRRRGGAWRPTRPFGVRPGGRRRC